MKNSSKKIFIGLIIVIIILLSIISYLLFFKKSKECPKCSAVTIKEVEVDPKHQFINYQGFKFKMSLDWDFVISDKDYTISNKEENLVINLTSLDIDYTTFISSLYQKEYLEKIQTSDDIIINKSSKENKNNVDYYIMEGTYNSYNYLIIAIGNDKKTVLINTQFLNKVSYDKLKSSVIDFAISPLIKISREN